ncbi:hypothetical protein [Spirosoma linguale]|uniref:Uncharacterized protein n=1 Tax=Spirosoma linguale (strain ATCC 33905 / DSM 74 / LMG 10896 / Claus 1) TaxID=504472 RepID=D2QE18_SPILD|nr:hypothetical protein Slin_5263 [Spirosoma linguale DSM 74]
MTMIYGLFGLLLASMLLARLTKPSNYAPASSKRRKKKNKLRLRDAQPYLQDEMPAPLTAHPYRSAETDQPSQPYGL